MARLEIELVGVNDNLKKVLKESSAEVLKFSNRLNFKTTGVDNLNKTLKKTKDLLKGISEMAAKARTDLANVNTSANRANSISTLNQERLATQQARTETQNYRTEQARLAAQTAQLRLATAQNRTATVAAAGSYREAQQTLTALGQAIRNAEGGFRSNDPVIRAQIRQYRELNNSLRAFDAQLGNHQRNVGNYGSVLRGLGGLVTTYFGFTALLAAGKKVLDTNVQISDSLADVRRTAGLTAKEADALAESLKKIDTRTGLKDLLGISVIGGQLGIAKEQLAGFTEAVDQLAVTLGGELKGGADGIAKSLGVLDNVFGITVANAGDVNTAYNKIGSAILGLGQSGLATGDFLADFGERVGGLAKQAGLSLPVILSYGAVLQENGVSAEVAGTAFKRLLSALSTKSSAFFAVAQMANANLTLKEFNTIVNTDTKRALDLFFAGLQKGGSSTIAFNSILKSLKISGAGVAQSVAAISNNIPALNKHIQDAQRDFENGTLSAEQFAIKNNNLAASVDKLGNAFTNAVSKGTIAAFFKSITDGLTQGIIKFDKFVNSSSWKEFKSRLLDADGGDSFEVNERIAQLTKKTNDNQKFLYPQGGSPEQLASKLSAVGQRGFNNYLAAVKKTADESKKVLDQFQKDVNSGRLRDLGGKGGIKDFTETYNKAKTYYLDLLALQKQLNFIPASAIPTPRSNADAPDILGKDDKKGFSLSDVLKKLREDLVKAEVQFGATFSDINQDKIKAYQTAIDDVAVALGKNNVETLKLIKSQQQLFQLPAVSPTTNIISKKDQDRLNKEIKAKITVDTTRTKVAPINDKATTDAYKQSAKELRRQLNNAVRDFGSNLYRTFTTLNQQADQSFRGIFSTLVAGLNSSLSEIFLNTFQEKLTKVFENTTSKLGAGLTAAVSAAGLAGGVVSGVTSKTSRVGQGLGGALSGAAAGTLIAPGIGTLIGGAIGALGGIFGAGKARKEQEALQKQQLEEAKKQTELLRQSALAYTSSIVGRMTDQGILTNVDVGARGELRAVVSGKDLVFVLHRNSKKP